MANPQISVVMSVYNGDSYLRSSVDSILSQSLQGFEFIIVDDASNDRTAEILASYEDSRIRILTNKSNLG